MCNKSLPLHDNSITKEMKDFILIYFKKINLFIYENIYKIFTFQKVKAKTYNFNIKCSYMNEQPNKTSVL